MIQFLLAAPRSGSGKTTMTCALLMALKRRGCAPCAFKSGPDYIDPMFHRAVQLFSRMPAMWLGVRKLFSPLSSAASVRL